MDICEQVKVRLGRNWQKQGFLADLGRAAQQGYRDLIGAGSQFWPRLRLPMARMVRAWVLSSVTVSRKTSSLGPFRLKVSLSPAWVPKRCAQSTMAGAVWGKVSTPARPCFIRSKLGMVVAKPASMTPPGWKGRAGDQRLGVGLPQVVVSPGENGSMTWPFWRKLR